MMAFNRSPVFPGGPLNSARIAPASTIGEISLLTGSADGTMISAINVFNTGSGAVNFKLNLTVGATTVTIAQGVTPSAQGANLNLINSSLLPFVDANDPYLVLAPNATLKFETTNSVANALHIAIIHASFTAEA